MVENVTDYDDLYFWILLSCAVLILFSVALAMHIKARRPAGSKGHRDDDGDRPEDIRADGYIDSFANHIEEAGGSMPPVVRLTLVGVIAWWVIYLMLYWTP
jgi:hypothetical protein